MRILLVEDDPDLAVQARKAGFERLQLSERAASPGDTGSTSSCRSSMRPPCTPKPRWLPPSPK